ncbi:MAG: thioredoxin family protein [Bacteroidia bacterium]
MNLQKYITAAIPFDAYKELLAGLLAEGKTTGTNHSEEMMRYAKLNWQRLTRIEKTAVLQEELIALLQNVQGSYTWLIITEGWCGDAAQNTPFLEKMAQVTQGKIETKYILRDEHLELIDAYLTNGGRSIPKLICINNTTQAVLFSWGPRPQAAQNWIAEAKAQGIDKHTIMEDIHKWYAKDKGLTLQKEWLELVQTIITNEMAVNPV